MDIRPIDFIKIAIVLVNVTIYKKGTAASVRLSPLTCCRPVLIYVLSNSIEQCNQSGSIAAGARGEGRGARGGGEMHYRARIYFSSQVDVIIDALKWQ